MAPESGGRSEAEGQELRVRLEDIKDSGLRLEAVSGPELLLAYVSGAALGYDLLEPVRSQFTLRRRGAEVVVQAHIATRQALRCDRCLADVEQAVDRQVEVTFRPHPQVPEGVESELSEKDLDVEFYGPDGVIDLGGVIVEELALAVPYRLLCREGCRGLCAGCGADLNFEECRCPAKTGDSRLAALKDLKIES
jgi:uncharacterized protein